MKSDNKKVIIVGAGPSGLFAAYNLLKNGFSVDLYDHSSGVGKKFLVAGNGGLNLTHSMNHEDFITRYGPQEKYLKRLLADFSAGDLRKFCLDLGVETFVGTSGRVFPREFNAANMLRSWLNVIKRFSCFFSIFKPSIGRN